MKAKLIKTDDGYHLKGLIKDVPKGINVYNKINDKECHFGFGTHSGKLSIKNCEDIENGYDLDELVIDEIPDSSSTTLQVQRMRFIHGFRKAVEILGDKKFSEEDMRTAFSYGMDVYAEPNDWDKLNPYQKLNKHIQSLQQTEWQVEVVMDRIPADLAPGGWDVFPKLDADGCLILKRVE